MKHNINLLTTQLGEGQIRPLLDLPADLNGYKFLWAPPPAATTDAALSSLVDDLMARVLGNGGANVIKVDDEAEIERSCPSNFNARSECFAAVVFSEVDPSQQILVCAADTLWVHC